VQTPKWVADAKRAVPEPALSFAEVSKTSRLTGLAAESAFWITFTLPWIALGAVASIGFVTRDSDPETVAVVQQRILTGSARVLSPEAVNGFLKPILDQINQGQLQLGFVGIVVALWSGSRLIRSLTEGIAVVNGDPNFRSYARARILALALYVVALISAAMVVAILTVGPDRTVASLANSSIIDEIVVYLIIFLMVFGLLVFLYRFGTPHKAPLRLNAVGALVALLGWVVGSLALGIYTTHLFTDFSIYAAVAAPIAIMLWSYVTAVAVFVGSAVIVTMRGDELTAAHVEAGCISG
jgi:membrane protein